MKYIVTGVDGKLAGRVAEHMLNSGVLGFAACADVICSLANHLE